MKKKLIIGSVLTVALLGAGVTTAMTVKQDKQTPVSHTQPVEKPAKKQEIKEAIVSAPEPVLVEQPPQSQPTLQEEPVAPPVEPQTYKWADQMAAAGIAPEHYAFVTDMVLTDDGWRLFGNRVWQGAGRAWAVCHSDLSLCITHANEWVLRHHGSWEQANYIWNRAGNF